MQVKILNIKIDEEPSEVLMKLNQELIWKIEHGVPLSNSLLTNLAEKLKTVLAKHGYRQKNESAELIHLIHHDNDLLNLPWHLAIETATNKVLTKGISTSTKLLPYETQNPLPLKILVFVAAPIDLEEGGVLNYEQEEANIINAFKHLIEDHKVEIDFANLGSLTSLEKALQTKHYHIVHINAHGIYDEEKETGGLLLEGEISMHSHLVTDRALAELFNRNADRLPGLVFLASCQTAAGTAVGGFKGITNQLLAAGIPAIVAMSRSILDDYATAFTSRLYEALSNQNTLPDAFRIAEKHLKKLEEERSPQKILGQWMIPQLYLNQFCEQLVNWGKADDFEKATQPDVASDPSDFFIGRRKAFSMLFPLLLQNQPLLLTGQSGVGKTALAQRLLNRLRLQRSNLELLVFDAKEFTLPEIYTRLTSILRQYEVVDIATESVKEQGENSIKEILRLFELLKKVASPALLLNDLSYFQEHPGGAIKGDYNETGHLLQLLCERQSIPFIMTGQYSLSGIANLYCYRLNQARFGDIWKKCSELSIGNIHQPPIRIKQVGSASVLLSFQEVVQIVYKFVGGNFTLLEALDKHYRESGRAYCRNEKELTEYLEQALSDILPDFRRLSQLDRIMDLLAEDAKSILQVFLQYKLPVNPNSALSGQFEVKHQQSLIDQLISYNILEQFFAKKDVKQKKPFVELAPPVRRMIEKDIGGYAKFSHRQAGFYYYYFSQHRSDWPILSLEEAFEHYRQSNTKRKIATIGKQLVNHYYEKAQFKPALHYGQQSKVLLQEETPYAILNDMGMVWYTMGDYQQALSSFEEALNKKWLRFFPLFKALTYNQIGLTYYRQHDFYQADIYFKKAYPYRWHNIDLYYAISNNLGLLASARGKHSEAIKYFHKSLKINKFTRRFLGHPDQSEIILANIGEAMDEMGETADARSYLEKSYGSNRRSKNLLRKPTILNNFAKTLHHSDDKNKAIYYQELSIEKSQQTGDMHGEAMGTVNLGFMYLTADQPKRAKAYLNQGLQLSRSIQNKNIEATALHNLGLLHYKYDHYEDALACLKQSQTLLLEIFGRNKHFRLFVSYHTIAEVYSELKDDEKALSYMETALEFMPDSHEKPNAEVAHFFHSIAFQYYKKKRYQESTDYYQKGIALELKLATPDYSAIFYAYINLSNSYIALSDYEKAVKVGQTAIALDGAKKASIKQRISIYESYGSACKHLSRYEEALKTLESAREMAMVNKLTEPQFSILNNIGWTYYHSDRLAEAENTFKEAINITDESLYPEWLITQHEALAMVQLVADNTKQFIESSLRIIGLQQKYQSELQVTQTTHFLIDQILKNTDSGLAQKETLRSVYEKLNQVNTKAAQLCLEAINELTK